MPSISSCPACHRDLTVPDSESADDVLRCPLCGSEFPAERILADSVRFPPLAIVVKAGNSFAGSGEAPPVPAEIEPAYTSGFATAPPESVTGGAGPTATTGPNDVLSAGRPNDVLSAGRPNDVLSAGRPNDLPPEPEHFDSVVEEEPTSEPGAGIDLSRLAVNRRAEPSDAASEAEVAEAGPATDGSDARGEEAADRCEAPVMRVSTQRRPRAGGLTAVIAQFVGVVVGGAMGLAIGYYILLWLVGAKADVLDMRNKLPSWLLPPIRQQISANSDPSQVEQNLAAKPFAGSADDPNLVPPVDEQGTHEGAAAPENDSSPLATAGPDAVEPTDGGQSSVVPASFDDEFDEASDDHPSPYAASERRDERRRAEQTLLDEPTVLIMLGPRNTRAHSLEELEAALQEVASALKCAHCAPYHRSPLADDRNEPDDAGDTPTGKASTAAARRAPCEFCHGSGIGKLTRAMFEALCQLAEVLTFPRIGGHEEDADALCDEATGLLRSVGESRPKREIIGRLAAARLDDPRRSSNGVVLAGTVSEVGWQGDLFAVRLILAGVARPVLVLGRDVPRPELAPRDHVLILGSIVDNPDGDLAGYLGELPQAVWGGLALKIPTRE